jgi:allantoicase
VRQVEVDTMHFKHNASSHVELRAGRQERAVDATATDLGAAAWQSLLPRVSLQPDTRHVYVVDGPDPAAYVRIDAFPDGGMSRVRILGEVTPAGRLALGLSWFNSLPAPQAHDVLRRAGLDEGAAQAIVERRPVRERGDALGHDEALSALLRGPV